MLDKSNTLVKGIYERLPTHLPEFANKQLKVQRGLGMTNQTFKVSADGASSVIFRYLSQIVDRKYENQILLYLGANKVCNVPIFFSNEYRIQKFIEDSTHQTFQQANSDKIREKILIKLFGMHQVRLPEQLQRDFFSSCVFKEGALETYTKLPCIDKGKEQKHQLLKVRLTSQYESVKDRITNYFKGRQSELKLCHQDVNNGNVLLKEINGSIEAILIDFEYSYYNHVSYDIANFLNECCFVYHSQVPGFTVHRKVTNEEIRRTCKLYPGWYEGIEKDVHFMLVACNYYWGLWSLYAKKSGAFSPIQHGLVRLSLFQYYSTTPYEE